MDGYRTEGRLLGSHVEGGLVEGGGRRRMPLLRWPELNPAEESRPDEERWMGREVEELWKRGG